LFCILLPMCIVSVNWQEPLVIVTLHFKQILFCLIELQVAECITGHEDGGSVCFWNVGIHVEGCI